MTVLRLSDLVSPETALLGWSTGFQAKCCLAAGGKKQKARKICEFAMLTPGDCTSEDSAAMEECLGEAVFEDRTQWRDTRPNKGNACCMGASQAQLQDSQAGGRVPLALRGVVNGVAPIEDQVSLEHLWRKYFENPTDWWDNRKKKLHSKSPDFRHKTTKEVLWIDSRNVPQWVAGALQERASSSKVDGGIRARCNSTGEHITGNAVYSRLLSRDRFLWATRMSQHTKSGRGREALKIYQEMRDSRVKPSSHTFVAALKACKSLRDLESAKQIHAHVVESGFESDVFVGTTLVDLYAKCGSLLDAQNVFEKMPRRDVVSWNAMILGYAEMGEGEVALQLYEQMPKEGLLRNERTFVGALKACSCLAACKERNKGDEFHTRNCCLDQVRAIHSDIVEGRFESDVFVGNILVDTYSKCGSLVDASHVFEKMPHRDVVSWNSMILGYAQMGRGEAALQLYAQMRHEGLIPNDRTFVAALKACSSLPVLTDRIAAGEMPSKIGSLDQVRAIHSDVVKGEFETDVFVATMLVDMYAKCGSLVDARLIFEKMPHRNVVSWNAMILGYAQMEEGEEGLQLYTQMKREGVVPDERTFVGALKACRSLAVPVDHGSDGILARNRCIDIIRALHSDIVKGRCELDIFVGTMLVDMYAKCGSLADARHIFDRMLHRDIISWNAMILGYAQMEDGQVALALYVQMQQEGLVPNDRTFVAALKACGAVAGLKKGEEIHAQISHTGLEPVDLFLQTSLIDMYGRCGSMEHAQQVFEGLPTKLVATWNALIAGYAHLGDSEIVFSLLLRMRQEGIQPNTITFLSVLTVCSHVGMVDKGQEYFEAMSKNFGITPTLEHYSCIVDLLARAGQVDKAMAMVKTMPFQPDIAVWRTLLGACRKWGNVELGNEAFQNAMKCDKNDPAPYVLMSNIFAATHRPDDAKDIQAMRVKTGAWKKPGRSLWTDTSGVVHTFVASDREHPESASIYSKLEELLVDMEAAGYVPHLGSVLRDIPDDEKPDSLCGHSERLAIAYALLKTPGGATIRVVKNLRVCEDCHTATKLISKIEKRSIICRDASRFHVYKDGECSCGDYW